MAARTVRAADMIDIGHRRRWLESHLANIRRADSAPAKTA